MKLAKFAFVCAAAVSVSALAEDYSNEIGLLKVNNANNLHTVLVGMNFAAADGSAVSVSNAVKTAGLPAGTYMFVYDSTTGKYSKYGISGNAWTSAESYYVDANGNVTSTEVTSPDAKTITAGSAVFLQLPSDATPSEVNVITAGKPVAAGAALSAGVNLCCFPVGKAVNLNQKSTEAADYAAPIKASPTATVFVEGSNKTAISTAGDTIVMPRSDTGASRVFYFDGTDWGYIGKANGVKTFITTDATIPGGIGFWYNSVQSGS